jgi:hypothetical protein
VGSHLAPSTASSTSPTETPQRTSVTVEIPDHADFITLRLLPDQARAPDLLFYAFRVWVPGGTEGPYLPSRPETVMRPDLTALNQSAVRAVGANVPIIGTGMLAWARVEIMMMGGFPTMIIRCPCPSPRLLALPTASRHAFSIRLVSVTAATALPVRGIGAVQSP